MQNSVLIWWLCRSYGTDFFYFCFQGANALCRKISCLTAVVYKNMISVCLWDAILCLNMVVVSFLWNWFFLSVFRGSRLLPENLLPTAVVHKNEIPVCLWDAILCLSKVAVSFLRNWFFFFLSFGAYAPCRKISCLRQLLTKIRFRCVFGMQNSVLVWWQCHFYGTDFSPFCL